MLYWINHRAGMQLQPGMILLSIAPAALCGGVWCGTAALVLLAASLPFSKTLVTQEERDVDRRVRPSSYLAELAAYWSRRAEQAEPSHAI